MLHVCYNNIQLFANTQQLPYMKLELVHVVSKCRPLQRQDIRNRKYSYLNLIQPISNI